MLLQAVGATCCCGFKQLLLHAVVASSSWCYMLMWLQAVVATCCCLTKLVIAAIISGGVCDVKRFFSVKLDRP